MSLKHCRECGQQVSEKAKSCPKCGAPQKKSNMGLTVFIIIVLLIGGIWYLLSCQSGDDREQKLAVAKEILQNNCNDLIDLTTEQVKNQALKIGLSALGTNRCDCIIDSLIPRLADKCTLSELEELKTKPISDIIQTTRLIEENSDVLQDCLLFKR